ncbi:hypothetical protein Tco_1571313 [Tanacetum coccineum]
MNKMNQRRDFSKSYSSVRRPFAKTTAQMSHSNAVMGSWGSAVKTSASYNWRNSRPNFHYNSGTILNRNEHPLKNMVDRGIFDSGCSGHMTGNKDQLEDFEEFNGGSVTFGGSKGYISSKGKIRVGNLDFDSVSFVKELGHFNLFSISQICDKEGVITDFNSLPTEIEVSPTPTLRIHNIHPKSQILGDPKSAVKTRSKVHTKSGAHALLIHIQKQQRNNHKDQQHCLFACFLSQEEPKKIAEALQDGNLPHGMKVIGTKWVYRNKRDERGVVVRNEARLVAQGAFLYGTIDEEVYVSQPPGFVDPDHLTQGLKVVKVCKTKNWENNITSPKAWDKNDIMPDFNDDSMANSHFSYSLQVQQNKGGIFISQDKYVAEILKQFDLVNVKATITPMETKVPLTKDEEAFDVDVHLHSMDVKMKGRSDKVPTSGHEHDAVPQSQPSSSILPVPSTSSPPVQSPTPTPIPATIPTPTPILETKPEPFEHTFEEPSPIHQHFSPLQEQAQG